MRLLRVELLRLRSRRSYWFLVGLAFVGIGLAIGSYVLDARPPSAADLAAAQAQVDAQAHDPFLQEQLEQCEEAHAEGGSPEYPLEFDCDEMLPQLEWFLDTRTPVFLDNLDELLPPAALMLALAGALIGATFVGAEWAAGTIGTHLLFEPRRNRVFAAKGGAVAIGVAVPAVVGLGAVFLGTWSASASWGSTALTRTTYETAQSGEQTPVIDQLSWLDLTLFGGRALAFAAVAAVGGYVLAMVFRSSIGAVGTLAAYSLVGEGLVRALWSGAEPWLLSNRLTAWLMGGHEIVAYPDSCSTGPCEPVITRLTTLDGGVYLGVLLVAGLALSSRLFRRRDVT
jgi:ABC-2 type transport system permease protein